MIDALLRAAGLRTGRFSSPHLSDARERIFQGGVVVPLEPLAELPAHEEQLLSGVRPHVAQQQAQVGPLLENLQP